MYPDDLNFSFFQINLRDLTYSYFVITQEWRKVIPSCKFN